MKSLLAFAVDLALLCMTGPAGAQSSNSPDWVGTYAGSYVCRDGEHGFYLDFTAVVPLKGGTFAVAGVLGLYPVIGGQDGSSATASGSFEVSSTSLAVPKWISHLGNWLCRLNPPYLTLAEMCSSPFARLRQTAVS